MSEPDRSILHEEVERINRERGTNLTVEGILAGPTKKTYMPALKGIGDGLLIGPCLIVAWLTVWAGVAAHMPVSGRVILFVIGGVVLGLSFFPARREYRRERDWRRELKAIDEMNRRVAARHEAEDRLPSEPPRQQP